MERIAQLITKGAARLDDSDLKALTETVERQPYYQAAHALLVQALHHRQDSNYGAALRRAAISVPSRTALHALVKGGQPRKAIVRTTRGGDRTQNLIENFLDTLPEEKPRRLTAADAATDYMAYLLQMEADAEQAAPQQPGGDMQGQRLIDDFIGQKQDRRIVLQERDDDEMLQPETQETGEFFTETMARIYIKQGKYDKAIKIIERLSVKIPRKNSYFADQLRFMRLLIENERLQNKQ